MGGKRDCDRVLEVAERGRRRIERHLAEARLPVGKTLASFDFEAVPMVNKGQVMALAAGDSWLEKGANLLLSGPPGAGKNHSLDGHGVVPGKQFLFGHQGGPGPGPHGIVHHSCQQLCLLLPSIGRPGLDAGSRAQLPDPIRIVY